MSDFTDMELAFCDILEPIAPTGTSVDDDLNSEYIRVQRVDGGTDSLGIFDTAVMSVECYAFSRPEQKEMVKQVRQALAGADSIPTSAGFVDRIWETSSPQLLPYDNEDIRFLPSTWGASSRLQENL